MKLTKFLLATFAFTGLAATAHAFDRLNTLERGNYECGLPGSADGDAWVVEEGRGFSITSASRYKNHEGRGVYLVVGDEVVFSRGPMKDKRFKRRASGLLQEMQNDGSLGRLRCHRVGRYRP